MNCSFASGQAIAGFRRIPACWMAKYSSFNAASSEGKLPRVLITLRRLRFRLSTAFVV